jgi:microcystin-dependent protein
MANPFVGEVRIFGGALAPEGWHLCDGSLLPIAEYTTLFTVLGTTYGGDGVSTFGLPDLRGRVPVHEGPGYPRGTLAGSETVALDAGQLPVHTHPVQAGAVPGNQGSPKTFFPAGCSLDPATKLPVDTVYFSGATPSTQMAPGAVVPVGGSVPHPNVQPFLVINFIIALAGLFPSSG